MRRPPEISQWPRFVVTSGTIALAIGVTLAFWAHWDITPLMEDGNVRRWQLWRLVTSALPHVSVYHIVFNVYWTWVFGTLIEEVFGHWRTAALFMVLALGSGAADYALAEGGIGLSGVGYGLFGMLWVLSRRDPRFNGAVDANTTALFVAWFFICIVLDYTGAMPVANVAHGAGAVLGALIGFATAPNGRRAAAGVGVMILVVAAITGSTVARPWVNLAKNGSLGEARLGYDALQAERNDDAARWYSDVTRMNPKGAGGWFNFAIALDRLGRAEVATTAFGRARYLEPANAEYSKTYAERMARRGLAEKKYEDAKRWSTELTQCAPNEPAAWFDLAISLDHLGDRANAIAAYDRVTLLAPQDPAYRAASERAAVLRAGDERGSQNNENKSSGDR